jgi:Carboxypeptidase regulatory-like domain
MVINQNRPAPSVHAAARSRVYLGPRRIVRPTWKLLPVVLSLLMAPGLNGRYAFGQGGVTTATLTGNVTDTTGARVPQAKVTLSSPQVGVTREVATDANGAYSFNLLVPSTYSLEINANGFKNYQQNDITLNAGQSATQDVSLAVGSEQQQITVTSQAPLLDTSNANIAASISAQQVVSLPLNLRNIYGLATLNSSVNNGSQGQVLGNIGTTGSADQDISFLNFGGGFFGTTAYLLDGVWDTAGGDWAEVIYVPSVDSVEEFKVQNNSFTAEYGWSTANVINVVTKSGTSSFHGSAYEFYRNSDLDANLYFANAAGEPKPAFNRNQYGVSAGGPLYIPKLYRQREKTFIFGLYEHLHSGTPLVGTYTVPSSAFTGGQFSALLGSQIGTDYLGRPILQGQIYNPTSARLITNGQVDPSTGLTANIPASVGTTAYIRDPIAANNVAAVSAINPVASKLISYYPAPTASGLVNNFVGSASDTSGSNEYIARVDQNLSDTSRLFFRYAYKQEYKTQTPDYWGADNPGGPGGINPNNRYGLAAGFSHVFTPTLTMNITAGFEKNSEGGYGQGRGFLPSTLGLPTYLDSITPIFPNVTVQSQSTLAPNAASDALRPNGSYSADLIKTIDRHTISFGFMEVISQFHQANTAQTDLVFNGNFTQGPDPDRPTGTTGNGLAQMELGYLDGGTTGAYYNPASSKYYYGMYVQDAFRVDPRLTLNLGIRYEIQAPPRFRQNTASYFDTTVPNPIGTAIGESLPGALIFATPSHRGVYDPIYTNFAPRIGFSDQVLPKLVLRGGFGIFYPPSAMLHGASTDGYSSTTAVVSSVNGGRNPNAAVTLQNPWPNGLRPITGNSLGELQDVGYSVDTIFYHRPSVYLEQYMLGLQYGFTPNDVLELSYVGQHGVHIMSGGQTGAPLSHSQLNPQYLAMGPTLLNNQVPNPFYGHIASGNSSCNLDQPTIAQSQLLQPFPQYCGVSENDSLPGFTLYDAFQANYNHRFSHGLNMLVSYTFSKFIDNVEGTASWAYVGYSTPANNYNLAAEKSVDGNDVPQSLVVNYIYDLPIGRGKEIGGGFDRKTDAVLGGWQVTGISTFKSGFPISVAGNDISSYGGTPRPDVIANPRLGKRTIHEWFNTGAFAYAPYGSFGTSPRYFSTLRGPDYVDWDIGIMKTWTFPENIRVQFRAEMFNAFNRANFYQPSGSYNGCDPNATLTCDSTFGRITNTEPSRNVQFAVKGYW